MDEIAEMYHHRQKVFFIAGCSAVVRIFGLIAFLLDDTQIDEWYNVTPDVYSFLNNMKMLAIQESEAMMVNGVSLVMDLICFVLGYSSDTNKINDQVAAIMNLIAVVFNIATHLIGVKFFVDHKDGISDAFDYLRNPDMVSITDDWIFITAMNTFLYLALFVLGSFLLLVLFKESLHWYGVSLAMYRDVPVEDPIVIRMGTRNNQKNQAGPNAHIEKDAFTETLDILCSTTELYRDMYEKLELAKDNEEPLPLEDLQMFEKSLVDLKAEISAQTKEIASVEDSSSSIYKFESEDAEDFIKTETRKTNVLQAAVMEMLEEFERLLYAYSDVTGEDYEEIRKKVMSSADEINEQPRIETIENED